MAPPRKTTATAERAATAEQATSKGEVAVFQPARLPYHDTIQERFGVDKGQWKVLVEAIYPAAKSIDAVVMALTYCKSRDLDPFKRPVHIVPMWDSARGAMVETVWPGISELRTTASRTKGYAGIDGAEFGPKMTMDFTGRVKRDGGWKDETVTVEFPEWCRITVYRVVNGTVCKFVGPKVAWLETYATQGKSDLPNAMWESRPEGQLEKCAEAAALRRAFPEEIGSDLTAEEMIGKNINDISGDVPHVDVDPAAAARDVSPPREIAKPAEPAEPAGGAEIEAGEARDGEPPPRQAKAPPKDDPISSGPPRTAAPKQEPAKEPATPYPEVEPHRISGNNHTYESWGEKYCDLIQTSPDIATVYKWIDMNSKAFMAGDPPKEQAGGLTRVEKARPSIYAKIKKTTEQTMQKLRDAQKKAEEKAAKKAPAAPPPSEMGDDAPAEQQHATGGDNPEDILKQIDAELAAVEDPDNLQTVWDTACEPLMAKLEFPPDQDAAQGIFNKHEKRLGGD